MTANWKKNVTLFLTSQILSLFGSTLVQCVLSWYITLETQSGAMMTVAIVCGFLPTFLISPFAGVWADRYDRKRLMIIADAIVAVSTIALVLAFRFGVRNIELIFAVMAVRGLGQGIQQPAVNAFIPTIVPEDKLMRVNSLSSSAQSLMMLLSPALAGVLMTVAPLESIFLIDIVTAAAAIAILALFVRAVAPERVPHSERTGYFSDLKLGLSYLARQKVVKTLFIFNAAWILMIAPVAMLCGLQATQKFGADAWRLSLVDIAFTIGMTVSAAILAARGGFKNRHALITMGGWIFAVTTALFGLMNNFVLYIVVMVVCGTAMPLFNTPFTVLLQESVEPEYMGRVFSFNSMISSLGMPLGLILFGPLGDVIGLSALFIATGVIQGAVTAAFMFNKTIKAAGTQQTAAIQE